LVIGVLAIQGAFIEHIQALQKLGTPAREVRLPQELDGLSGLIIPGGESTSILRVMHDFDTYQPLKELAEKGLPVWGTCAGMICLASRVVNNGTKTLAVMDISVKRNAFGRQVDSFETYLNIPVLGKNPYHAVFIRAPVIETVGEGVTILARLDNGTPVAAQQGKFLATSFHPELTDDLRFHRYFLELAVAK
jgi:5'-phosphate synthase pdxT subunit